MANYNSLNKEALIELLVTRSIAFSDTNTKAELIELLESDDTAKAGNAQGTSINVSSSSDVYALSPFIKEKGYKAKIGNAGTVIVHKTQYAKGTKDVIKPAYCEVQTGFDASSGKPIMSNTGDTLSGLSDDQVYQLVYAGVIVLSDEQSKAFNAKYSPKQ